MAQIQTLITVRRATQDMNQRVCVRSERGMTRMSRRGEEWNSLRVWGIVLTRCADTGRDEGGILIDCTG